MHVAAPRPIVVLGCLIGAAQLGAQQTPRLAPDAGPGSFLPSLATIVVAGDFDLDGDLDLVLPNGETLLNDGDGRFQAPTGVAPPTLPPTAVAFDLADLDGDGVLDLVYAAGGAGFFHGTGAGGFAATATPFPAATPIVGAQAVLCRDFDADGDVDALVATGTGGKLWYFAAAGPGVLIDASATAVPAGVGATSLTAADFDGDGDLDVVLSLQASNSAGQIYSEPRMMPLVAGVFAAPFALPAPSLPFWAQTFRTVAGDFDGDGLPDLAYAGSGHVLRNAGGFTFVAIETLRPAPTIANPVTSQAVASLATLDVDADGQDELAYSYIAHNAATASTELRRYAGGSPAGGFRISEMYEGSLLAFDADGDGDRDLATTAARRLTVHLNDGAGGLVASGPTIAPSNLSLRRHFGDVDADGDLDVLAVPETWAGVFFFFIGVNDGYGAFAWKRETCPGLAQGSTGLAYGDSAVLDHGGDGDADLYLGGFHPPGQASRDVVLVNGGAAGWSAITIMSGASFHASGHLEIGRFNADAYDDVASSVNGVPWLTSPVKILFGGPGGLGAPTNAGFNGWGPMAAGDFDGDGDVDLFQHGPQTPLPPFPPLQPPPPPTAYTPILALNGGAGAFTIGAAPTPLPPLSSLRPWTADLNGDGAQDVLVYATAYLQAAPGVFTTTPAYAPTVPMFGGSVQAFPCDVDGDGAADVLAGDGMWYRSQGALPLPFEGALPFPLTRVHFGDPDRDGDVDVLTGDQLVLNRTRHLLRDGLFRTGRALRFLASGAPNAPWLLAASVGTLDLELPPYGRLLIDPATVALIGGGVLDATGAATWSSIAPSGAAAAPLLGLPIYVQAVVDGGAPQFTGAWTAVLIDV